MVYDSHVRNEERLRGQVYPRRWALACIQAAKPPRLPRREKAISFAVAIEITFIRMMGVIIPKEACVAGIVNDVIIGGRPVVTPPPSRLAN